MAAEAPDRMAAGGPLQGGVTAGGWSAGWLQCPAGLTGQTLRHVHM